MPKIKKPTPVVMNPQSIMRKNAHLSSHSVQKSTQSQPRQSHLNLSEMNKQIKKQQLDEAPIMTDIQ